MRSTYALPPSIALAYGPPALEKLIRAPAEKPVTEQMLQSGEY